MNYGCILVNGNNLFSESFGEALASMIGKGVYPVNIEAPTTPLLSSGSSRLVIDDGNIVFTDGGRTTDAIIPDIVNVESVISKRKVKTTETDTATADIEEGHTVFVEFADGTKEVAVLTPGDTFNIEHGILICIVKKILSQNVGSICSGSSAYNKIVKHAMTKIDAKKKAQEAKREQAKQENIKKNEERQAAKRSLNDEREELIKIYTEAFKRAILESKK